MVQPVRGAAAAGGVVTNEGDDTVIVEDIALSESNGLELLDRYIIPMDGEDDFVLGAGSTESDDPAQEAAWATAQQPGSFEVQPGTQANVVVAVAKTSDASGTAQAIRVTYSADGKQYTVDTSTTIELATTACF